jgi:hypothetical protein
MNSSLGGAQLFYYGTKMTITAFTKARHMAKSVKIWGSHSGITEHSRLLEQWYPTWGTRTPGGYAKTS